MGGVGARTGIWTEWKERNSNKRVSQPVQRPRAPTEQVTNGSKMQEYRLGNDHGFLFASTDRLSKVNKGLVSILAQHENENQHRPINTRNCHGSSRLRRNCLGDVFEGHGVSPDSVTVPL